MNNTFQRRRTGDNHDDVRDGELDFEELKQCMQATADQIDDGSEAKVKDSVEKTLRALFGQFSVVGRFGSNTNSPGWKRVGKRSHNYKRRLLMFYRK